MKSDNELIAEFMGHDVPKEYLNGSDRNNKYDTSWEWLMDVIDKISEHVYEEQEENNGIEGIRIIKHRSYPRTFGMMSIEGKKLFRFNRMPLHEADKLIEAAYSACVEFIQWYNEQPK